MHFYQPHQPNHLIIPMLYEDDLQINSLYPSQSNPAASNLPAMQGYPMQQQNNIMTKQDLAQLYDNLTLFSTYSKQQTALIKKETALIKRDIAYLDKAIKELQLGKVLSADEAFSQTAFHDGRFTVNDTRGQTITLCSVPLDSLYYIVPESPYGREGYFLLQFRNRQPHCIPQRYLSKPTKLLAEISAAAGEPIKTCSNPRKIGGLLALALPAEAKWIPFLYRYGWLESQGGWLFQLCGGKTHCDRLPAAPEEFPQNMVLTELDRGATLRAAEQIVTLFQVFQDELFSQVLFLWWNASFLYTLLAQGEENPLPMGLGLLCQSGRTARCLEALFRWYSDPVISLGDGPERFLVQLGQRADEPLLIRDSLCSDKNEAALLQALACGFVPAGNQADIPLRAPVTLLSEGRTPLICNPNFFTLEITDQDLSPQILPKFSALLGYREDYFRGLARFVQQNPELLRAMMAQADTYDDSEYDQDYELSANGARVLSTLRCVRSFIQAYLEHLAPAKELKQDILSLLSEDEDFLLDTLEDSNTAQDDLTHVFLGIASRKMLDHSFQLVDIRKTANATVQAQSPVVYYNSKYYFFTQEAFRAICRDCHATTRTVLNSIAPLLEGAPYCSGSAMTRIPGDKKRTRAYQISRKHFRCPFVQSSL